MSEIPIEIADDESIIRFVLYPFHVEKSNKLKKHLYRPKKGSDLVSVARLFYLGADVCKQKAKEAQTAVGQYTGLARILAIDIRLCEASVEDARERYYPGHAHLSTGYVMPDGDPPDPETVLLLDERAKALVKKTTYYPDRDVSAEAWAGDPIS